MHEKAIIVIYTMISAKNFIFQGRRSIPLFHDKSIPKTQIKPLSEVDLYFYIKCSGCRKCIVVCVSSAQRLQKMHRSLCQFCALEGLFQGAAHVYKIYFEIMKQYIFYKSITTAFKDINIKHIKRLYQFYYKHIEYAYILIL